MRKPNSSDVYDSYSGWRTYQMSDHLPMWVELQIDFGEEYLTAIAADLQARLDG
jgi:hypothetical protein